MRSSSIPYAPSSLDLCSCLFCLVVCTDAPLFVLSISSFLHTIRAHFTKTIYAVHRHLRQDGVKYRTISPLPHPLLCNVIQTNPVDLSANLSANPILQDGEAGEEKGSERERGQK